MTDAICRSQSAKLLSAYLAGGKRTETNKLPAHHPGTPSEEIKDTGEKAFQRAIMNGGMSYLSADNKDWIEWIDFEVPVGDSDKPRDNCVDLLGKDASGRYVLCELKFSGKSAGNGSPQEAAEQLKDYAKQLADNIDNIRLHENAAKDVFDPKQYKDQIPRLIIAADLIYWLKRRHEPKDSRIENYAVFVKPNEFEKQKNGKVQYKPEMPESGFKWSKLG